MTVNHPRIKQVALPISVLEGGGDPLTTIGCYVAYEGQRQPDWRCLWCFYRRREKRLDFKEYAADQLPLFSIESPRAIIAARRL